MKIAMMMILLFFQKPSEICDGFDNNCDGQADEGTLETFMQTPMEMALGQKV